MVYYFLNFLISKLNAIKASRVDNATYKIKFRSLLLKVARSEIGENVQYDQVTKSLLDFLKLQKSIGIETDFTADQVIELVNIFQRILKMKISLLEGLLGVWSQLCDSEAVHEDEINDVMGQIVCLNEFSTFVNLNVVAERLSSPKVRLEIQFIERNVIWFLWLWFLTKILNLTQVECRKKR